MRYIVLYYIILYYYIVLYYIVRLLFCGHLHLRNCWLIHPVLTLSDKQIDLWHPFWRHVEGPSWKNSQ